MALFRHDISSGTGIRAAPERVWEVLTDFAAYPAWNPFITQVEGRPEAGERLEVRLEPSGGRAMTFRPRVTEARFPEILRWRGRLGLPGVFDREQTFIVELLAGGGVHFKQEESFSGLLVPFLRGALRRTEEGLERMNVALARRAEAGGPRAAGLPESPKPVPPPLDIGGPQRG